MKKISQYKVLVTTALAVDGAVKASGEMLSVDEVKNLIK
ncbi:MAG: thioredoxin family protein [Thermodesulfobacteriota bacterium]